MERKVKSLEGGIPNVFSLPPHSLSFSFPPWVRTLCIPTVVTFIEALK
jgi:hypothetical protein